MLRSIVPESGRNVSDAPSAFPEGGFARRAVLISRGSACSYSPKGDLPKAACGAGWHLPEAAGRHLPLAARVFISRRENRDEDCCGCRWVIGWHI